MKQIQFKTLIVVLLLSIGVLPVFADALSSAYFYGQKAGPTPKGAGKIYVYHAQAGNLEADGSNQKIKEGKPDLLPTSASIAWANVEDGSGGTKIDIYDENGYYGGDGFIYAASSGGSVALDVYFFAKPNPGYRFLGWKEGTSSDSNPSGDFITGSNRKYTLYSKEAKVQGSPTYSIWNNGADPEDVTWSPSGYYADEGYYYLRHVHEMSGNSSVYYYAYFEVIPQLFTFGGTGDAELTYTAKAGSDYTVNGGASDIAKTATTDSTSNDITLTLESYDSDLYKFKGWKYDYTDLNDVRKKDNLISTAANAIYSFNGDNESEAAARRDVKIYPDFEDVSDKAALVDFDGSKDFFDSWADALTDALTTRFMQPSR